MTFQKQSGLILLVLVLLMPGHAPVSAQAPDAPALIAACQSKGGESRFRYERCLIGEYERLEKQTEKLTDKLLGLVGGHRPFGRLKIIQWSNAISKSQSRWHKFVVWDCEWNGHILDDKKQAASAMTTCRIERTAARVKQLENRVQVLEQNIKTASHKDN